MLKLSFLLKMYQNKTPKTPDCILDFDYNSSQTKDIQALPMEARLLKYAPTADNQEISWHHCDINPNGIQTSLTAIRSGQNILSVNARRPGPGDGTEHVCSPALVFRNLLEVEK